MRATHEAAAQADDQARAIVGAIPRELLRVGHAPGRGHPAVTGTADAAYQVSTALLKACAAAGMAPSICEPEKLVGRCSGRTRLVLREHDARALAAVLTDFAERAAAECGRPGPRRDDARTP